MLKVTFFINHSHYSSYFLYSLMFLFLNLFLINFHFIFIFLDQSFSYSFVYKSRVLSLSDYLNEVDYLLKSTSPLCHSIIIGRYSTLSGELVNDTMSLFCSWICCWYCYYLQQGTRHACWTETIQSRRTNGSVVRSGSGIMLLDSWGWIKVFGHFRRAY